MATLPPAPEDLCFGAVVLRCDQMVMSLANPKYVPFYHFHIYDSHGTELGHINFRVGDTEHIHQVAGHIGYAIFSEHRGNGYAAQACLALKPWIKQFYEEVWITCNPKNLASRRTIEKIGGRLIDTIAIPEDERASQMGEREKRRYRWTV